MIKLFIKYRDSFAIAMFCCGLPVIYFFRDGLKLAPNSAAFTIAGVLGPLALSLLFKDFRKFYAPNPINYLLCILFTLIMLGYLIFRDPYTGLQPAYDYFAISFIFFYFLVMVQISIEDLNKNFLPIAFFLCVLGALSLMYSVYKDPLYVLGQRASIKYREGDEGNTGNPHVFSKVAFFGVILSFLLLKYNQKYKVNILIPLTGLLMFLVTLILTQTMITFITTAIFFALFFRYNLTLRSASASFLSIFKKWYILLILAVGIYKGVVFITTHDDMIKPFTIYMSNRFDKILGTITMVGSDDKNIKIDQSANMRVHQVTLVFERMAKNFNTGKIRYIIFGNGYKTAYVDVPLIEALDSFGVIGFIIFCYMYFYMIKVCMLEMRAPKSIATEFIAYGFIYFIVQNLTGGLIMDFNRWGYFVIVARFIAPPLITKFSSKTPETKIA